ncbi:MAG: hypothetical protein NVS9B4_07810 [Candidatus Acidiferrum sp.]
MTAWKGISSQMEPRRPVELFFVLACASTIFLNGCSMRRKPTIVWKTAVLVRPVAPPHAPTIDGALNPESAADPLPELRLVVPAPPSPLTAARIAPPRPRVAQQRIIDNRSSKPETPWIEPQMTVAELATAQQQTNSSLIIAEKNLSRAQGKTLNAEQADLVSKIKSFINDAKGALQASDWTRANSLARKAQVLSQELARSL